MQRAVHISPHLLLPTQFLRRSENSEGVPAWEPSRPYPSPASLYRAIALWQQPCQPSPHSSACVPQPGQGCVNTGKNPDRYEPDQALPGYMHICIFRGITARFLSTVQSTQKMRRPISPLLPQKLNSSLSKRMVSRSAQLCREAGETLLPNSCWGLSRLIAFIYISRCILEHLNGNLHVLTSSRRRGALAIALKSYVHFCFNRGTSGLYFLKQTLQCRVKTGCTDGRDVFTQDLKRLSFCLCNSSSTQKPACSIRNIQFYPKPDIPSSAKQSLECFDLVRIFLNKNNLVRAWNFE